MKPKKLAKDLTIITLILLIGGLVILYNASTVLSIEKTGKPYYYFLHQLLYGGVVGIIAFLFFKNFNYKSLKKLSLLIFFAALILSALVFVPQLGYKHGGAQRWLSLGGASLQPAEFLKLALIIYLAAFLGNKKSHRLVPFLFINAAIAGLMTLQNDFGTLVLIILVGLTMYFLSGAKLRNIIIVVIIYAAAFSALVYFFPHRMERIRTFLNPEIDPSGISYQINQAVITIGSGGLFGRGLGHSVQKYSYLPEPMGDSIFAIIAEEIGFIGSLIYIVLLVLLISKGFKVGRRISDDFGKLLSCGIVCWFGIQAVANIGAISGLIPLTGIPLPFVSYGGSALAITLAGAGILVNISKHTH